MDKFKRRQLLLGGVAAGTAATLGTEYVRRERAKECQAAIDAFAAEFYDPEDIIQAAMTGDTRMVEEFQAIQAAAAFPPPPIAYNRNISKRLILLSRLANHIVDTYRRAVNAEAETNQQLAFPVTGIA